MPHDSGASEGGRARPHPLIRGAHQSSNSILVNSCQVCRWTDAAWKPYLAARQGRRLGVCRHRARLPGGPVERRLVSEVRSTTHLACVTFACIQSIFICASRNSRTCTRSASCWCSATWYVVLLTQNDHQPAIKELTKIALVNRMVLLVAWTYVA